MPLHTATQQRLDTALRMDLHARSLVANYLSVFLQAASEDPDSTKPLVLKLCKLAYVGDNAMDSLFCLMNLADVSQEMKVLIVSLLPGDFISYWMQEVNQKIAGNARILHALLHGASLNEFIPEKRSPIPYNMINHLTIHGSVINSNIAAGEHNNQSIHSEQNFHQLLGLLNEAGEEELAEDLQNSKADKDKSFGILKSIIENSMKYGPTVVDLAKLLIEKWPF